MNISPPNNGVVPAKQQLESNSLKISLDPSPRPSTEPQTKCSVTYSKNTGVFTAATGQPILTDLHSGAKLDTVADAGDGVIVALSLDAEPASFFDVPIARLHCLRFTALARAKLYWMIPVWGATCAELPVETQMLLIQHPQLIQHDSHVYSIILPLIDKSASYTQTSSKHIGAFRCSLRPPHPPNATRLSAITSYLLPARRGLTPPGSGGCTEEERVVLRVESGDETVKSNNFGPLLYIASGVDPYRLIDESVAAAARLSGTGRARIDKQVPAILDKFAWCTWDAMYSDVSPAGIQKGLKEFENGGIKVPTVIIDDGWQTTDVDDEYKPAAIQTSVSTAMETWSLERVQSRRLSAELLFQDMQITEPLRYIEGIKREEQEERKRSSGTEQQKARNWLALPFIGFFNLKKFASSAFERVSGAASLVEVALMRYLAGMLQDLPSGSNRIEFLAYAAAGPLRKAILRFYAQASGHSRRLTSLRANSKFSSIDSGPNHPMTVPTENFGDVVKQLKERYGLEYVMCWHAMSGGYWSGVMPGRPETGMFNATIMHPRPSAGTLEVDESMRWAHPALAGVSLPDDPARFFSALHQYLAASGVDGVKVDVQATVSMFGFDSGGYAAISERYHTALEESVHRHIPGNNMINSMCCSLEDVYNMKYSMIARVGEDYYPTLKASHTAHISNAAFTTLMIGVAAFPDYDMFHSKHPSSHLHATARAISGGLVYVSDRAGDHDFNLLKRLVLPNGEVLRCNLPARPTLDCLFHDVSRDTNTVLKLWNMNNVCGVVACFNVQGSSWAVKKRNYYQHDSAPRDLKAFVKPSDCWGIEKASQYAMYRDSSQELMLLAPEEHIGVVVPGGGGHDVFTVAAVRTLKDGSVKFAPIGLVNMLNAGGAVIWVNPFGSSEVEIGVKGCGCFVCFCSRKPTSVFVNDKQVEYEYRQVEQVGELRVEVFVEDDLKSRVRVLF